MKKLIALLTIFAFSSLNSMISIKEYTRPAIGIKTLEKMEEISQKYTNPEQLRLAIAVTLRRIKELNNKIERSVIEQQILHEHGAHHYKDVLAEAALRKQLVQQEEYLQLLRKTAQWQESQEK